MENHYLGQLGYSVTPNPSLPTMTILFILALFYMHTHVNQHWPEKDKINLTAIFTEKGTQLKQPGPIGRHKK